MGTTNIFNICSFFFSLFHEVRMLIKSFMLDKLQSPKKCFYFFDGKTLIYPSDFLTFNVNFTDHFKVSLIRSSCNTFFMLDGRSAPTPYPREFFGWRLLLYAFFTFQLECQVKICCLTSDIINGLFRKKYKQGKIKG